MIFKIDTIKFDTRKKYNFTNLLLVFFFFCSLLFFFESCKRNNIQDIIKKDESKTSFENEATDLPKNGFTDLKKNSFVPFKYNGKYGLMDKNFDVKIEPNYLRIEVYDYCVATENENHEYSVYDNNLNQLYNSPDVYFMEMISEKYCQLRVKSQLSSYVLLNLFDGSTTEMNSHDRLAPGNLESEKYYASNTLSAFVNKDLKTAAFPEIKFGGGGYPFREGKAVAYCYNLNFEPPYSVINESGEQIISGIREVGKYFTEGLLPVIMEDGKSGYINGNGEFEIECKFNVFYKGPKDCPRLEYLFYDGIAVVNKFDKDKYAWFLLERNHNFIKLDERYEPTDYEFHNGHLLVKINDGEDAKYAFINKKAEKVFGTDFDYADNFVNGYAVAVLEGRDILISADGNIFDVEKDILK